MRNELDVFGVYVPSYLPVAIAALFVGSLVRKLLVHGGVYRFIANRSLFDTAMYVCLFSLMALAFK
ncbi:DUF1656 domain-containing protein [Agrobacterium rhizogenes]|uniref:DUF1656 domain-containing protein n=1 Tax=Rhizobium rhizogenes NBRC 13257 TaxID=1220581 RepID=A0AA87QKW0_RHIRH|nr:DUF1656 domain-containing protein [Rhizobium rhizogenes]NTF59269.1 DUF1656 domain-containing protein [Rhizobium rhizogenes]NTF78853.1 DUF1656 domain-containing protein [Rhizobium rhizogenes]NTF98421.1 DUF1656 domain-containing protein [Rhizobium rhizogenes]NTG64592.1 DUF1656 domain-containing protein [Rhizobium rhizogenes]NTG71175.1 DUF1656 domain-containing protein [Rhizobium rhizogenes]